MASVKFDEIGVGGLREFAGFISEAYNQELRWPSVQPLYSRMRRSDPEVSIVRNIYASLARRISFDWQLPDDATDQEKAAAEFGATVLDDMEGGISGFAETMLGNVPFMGWGWWEVLWGVRSPDWKPPAGDQWRSEYNDGRIGIRRLAWRDSSSFYQWKFSENGIMTDMVQQRPFGAGMVTIPLDRSLHITFGDAHNPEGLTPLEALWRLERIKYGLEVIQGIGFEHSAGHLSVKAEEELTPTVNANVRAAARAVMMAQEGNYAVWPKGYTGEIIDSNFSAASAILETIKYWGVLKLTLFNMQWVALSATTGSGSYSAMSDSSSMFMITFNAMMDGFAAQMDAQIGRMLFTYNDFGAIRRPHLVARPIEKVIGLGELGGILGPLAATMPLGDEDYKAIRARTGFLPETLPDLESAAPALPEVAPPPPVVASAPDALTDELRRANDNLDRALSMPTRQAFTTDEKPPINIFNVSEVVRDQFKEYEEATEMKMGQYDGIIASLAGATQALIDNGAVQPTIIVNVPDQPAPVVNMAAAVMPAPVVNVTTPAVTVNVDPTPVVVENTVNVPASQSAKVKRDSTGRIVGLEAE